MGSILKSIIVITAIILQINVANAYNSSWSSNEDATSPENNPSCNSRCGCIGDVALECADNRTCNSGSSGNDTGSPVYLKTGFFTWSNTDISLKAPMNINLTRTYTAFEPHLGLFGNSTVSSFEKLFQRTIKYYKNDDGFQESRIIYVYRDEIGKRKYFEYNDFNDTFTTKRNKNIQVERIEGEKIRLKFDGGYEETYEDGYLTEKKDKNGNKITLIYDDNYLLQKVQSADAYLELAYNTNGFVSQITDQANRVWNYNYEDGVLKSVTNPMNYTMTYAYKTFKFKYDAKVYQLMTSVNDYSGKNVVDVTYYNSTDINNAGKVLTYTMGTKKYTYSYKSVKEVHKSDNTNYITKYYLDDDGLIETVKDTNNKIKEREIKNNTTNVLTKTNANGDNWITQLDNKDREIEVTDPLGNITKFEYKGDNQNPVKIIDASGNITLNIYDADYNLIKNIDYEGNTTEYGYDNQGNVTSIIDSNNQTTQITYNNLSLPTSIKDALNRTTTIEYDTLGRRVSRTDPAGKEVAYEYDDLDRIVKYTNALNQSILYTYDKANRLLSITDPVGNKSTYEYDNYGRLSKENKNDININSYTYNTKNLLTLITRKKGTGTIKLEYTYSDSDRLQTAKINGKSIKYEYDEEGWLTKVSNDKIEVFYEYDALGNILKEIVKELDTQKTHEIVKTYDKDENISSLSFLNKTLRYTRDNNGLLKSIKDGSNTYGLSYDKNQYLINMTLPNSIEKDYVYNKAGELTGIITPIENFEYEYNLQGYITKKTVDNTATNYAYDDIGRLIEENQTNFTYDVAGNNTTNSSTYDTTNNKLLSNSIYTFTYDDNHNLSKKVNTLTKEEKHYTFNDRNQLLKVESKDSNKNVTKTILYTYDGIGRRYSKTVNGIEEKYLYDNLNLIAILDENNNTKSTIIHNEGIDEPLAITTNDNTYYYIKDHQGSVKALVDENQNIVEEYSYDAYGKVINKSKTASTNNPFTYTARVMDDEDLYYYRARYYDPTTQRFLSQDPIGFSSGDFNFYRYVGNNPVNFIDPSGLAQCQLSPEHCRALYNCMNQTDNFDKNYSNAYKNANDSELVSKLKDIGTMMNILDLKALLFEIMNRKLSKDIEDRIKERIKELEGR